MVFIAENKRQRKRKDFTSAESAFNGAQTRMEKLKLAYQHFFF
jgi:hypothetical protein